MTHHTSFVHLQTVSSSFIDVSSLESFGDNLLSCQDSMHWSFLWNASVSSEENSVTFIQGLGEAYTWLNAHPARSIEVGVQVPIYSLFSTLSFTVLLTNKKVALPCLLLSLVFLRFTPYKVSFQLLSRVGLQNMMERTIRSNCLSKRLLTNIFCFQPHIILQSCAVLNLSWVLWYELICFLLKYAFSAIDFPLSTFSASSNFDKLNAYLHLVQNILKYLLRFLLWPCVI